MKDSTFAEDKAYSLVKWDNTEPFKCICPECENRAEDLLKIITPPQPGYYCHQCSHDLKWHGIAQEVEHEDG
jgi:hypothetical protein